MPVLLALCTAVEDMVRIVDCVGVVDNMLSSEVMMDFVGKCLTTDPRQRLDTVRALQHPFVQDYGPLTRTMVWSDFFLYYRFVEERYEVFNNQVFVNTQAMWKSNLCYHTRLHFICDPNMQSWVICIWV